jgi:mannose-6-phosphate isomerase
MIISRPMISVSIRCVRGELVRLVFSSTLDIAEVMGTTASFEERPWGSYTVLDEGENFKVKRIEVSPGKRLSYQRHSRRSEHWYVVCGTAKVTLNGEEKLVSSGEAIDIRVRDAHRVENPHVSERLVFIETQTGDYFGEDDIERLEDDFGRN